MGFLFGVDLGGTAVKIGCFSQEGVLLEQWQLPTERSQNGAQILPQIAAELDGYIREKQLNKQEILGVGIGVPGPVSEDGRVLGCVNLGWGLVNVKKELSRLCGLAVWVGNDATLAALGEMHYGAGKGIANGVMVTLGTGVGGGVILNGKPISGACGAAGEIGHMVIRPEETESCTCGKRGCAEQYCSATGITRRASKFLAQTGEVSALSGIKELDCKDVFDAARAGDPLACRALDKTYDDLGLLLANLCCVIDPEIILLGGGVSKAGQMLLEGVRGGFQKYAFSACRETKIALAALGNDAGIYGACRLVIDATE